MHINSFLTGFFSWIFTLGKKHTVAPVQNFCAMLLFLSVALVLSMTLTNKAQASEHKGAVNYENIDNRWLPWIGSWRLISNKVNTGESSSKEEYFLTIEPGSNSNYITMRGHQGDEILVEEEIIADGLRHPLKDEKCSGYYLYSWSETGTRLLFNSESNCPGDPPRRLSGISLIDDNRDWLDIQLLQNGLEKAISIRRYRNIENDSISSSRFNPDRSSISRISAGKNFSISEIIELSSKIEPEILEAALLEIRKPFPINSKQLIKLADSGVNSRVLDLMVAFSFPDKFTVEQDLISLKEAAEPRNDYQYFRHPYHYYSYYCPILPWHWAPSSYMSYAYGYSYLGWYLTDEWYYPLWTYPPVYYYGGGGGAVRENGTMIQGHGYTASQGNPGTSRHARPRYAPAAQRAPVQSSSSSYSGGASSSYTGGSVPAGSSGSPSASPQGYIRGGH